MKNNFIHSDMNRIKNPSFLPRIKYGINSSRNPVKDWIPGQARNDKLLKTYVVMYNISIIIVVILNSKLITCDSKLLT